MPRIVILAGGISSRMKNPPSGVLDIDKNLLSDSDNKSKSMIRLGSGNKPFLDFLLMNISRSGYNDVVIVVNEKDTSIINYYKDPESRYEFPEINISFAYQPIPPGREKPMGTADALYHACLSRPDWKGKKFTMCNSDNLYSVESFKILLNSPYTNSMIDYESEGLGFDKERIGKFAITLKDDDNFLTGIIEKPPADLFESVLRKDGFVGVSMNIFRFDYDMILPFLIDTPVNPERNEKEIPTAIRLLIEKFPGSFYAYRRREYVPDLSSKNDIPVVKKFLEDQYGKNLTK